MDASLGTAVELPNVQPIIPYMGLFMLVTLKPADVTGCRVLTPYLPRVSIIQGSTFTDAPSNTLATAENTACIFDSKTVNDDTPLSLGVIPLSESLWAKWW